MAVDLDSKLASIEQTMAAGKAAAAITQLKRLLAREGHHPEVCHIMAGALMMQAQFDQAAHYAREALRAPEHPARRLRNLGAVLNASGFPDEAIEPLSRVLAQNPDDLTARHELARAHWELKNLHEAHRLLEEGLARTPAAPNLAAMHATVLVALGRAGEAVRSAGAALNASPGELALATILASAMNYVENLDPSEVLAVHRHVGRIIESRVGAGPRGAWGVHHNPRDPERKLRVGLLSHDLKRHSVAHFAEPILRHLPRGGGAAGGPGTAVGAGLGGGLELAVYHTGNEDAVTARLRPLADRWLHAQAMTDAELAERLRLDGVDVLIETSGLTLGHRMGVMARKPAPVQVTAIGYPNTTGLRQIDHRVVDDATDPAGADLYCQEQLLRLPGCFLCYQPPEDAPEVATRPAEGPIVFGSFNAPAKITGATLSLWSRVLAAVPGSRLALKGLALKDAALRDDLAARLAAAGVPGERVELLEPEPTLAAHLARYHGVDVALDTFPYNGTTTTCEALWMGVPVVTLRGESHASRVGMSLLRHAGLGELVAKSPDEFVSIASGLAADRAALASRRAGLRARLAASEVCDGPGYGRRLALALRGAWRAWCRTR